MFGTVRFAGLLVACLSTLCSLCLCGESSAASPQLSAIQPRGAQRGTEAILSFIGNNLADAQEVLMYSPGFTVKKLEPLAPNSVRVTLAIAPECPLGEHGFRIRTATGISDLRTLWVGALTSIEEKEPNSEFDKPQTMPMNTTVHGTIGGEDVDYFEVECKKGQRLAVEIEGMRLGGFWDPYVAILDSRRFELATSDDSPMLGQDGGCAIVVPADGKYVVQVRESAYGGGIQYRLHIGTFPYPTAVVPAGGRPGEEIEVRFIGDPSGEIRQKVKLPATANPEYRIHCQTPDGINPTGIRFPVIDLPNTIEAGASITPQTATLGVAPGAFNGIVAQPGQTKYFKFAGKKGQVFEIRCHARQLGSPLDSVLTVMNPDGGVLAANDDSNGPDSYLRFGVPDDKEYLIGVRDHLNAGGPAYFFRVELSPVQPEAVLSLPRVDGNNPQNQDRQSIAVPKGNRFAVLLSVARRDFGGGMTIGFDQLPPGMTFTADPLDAGQSVVPVVFEAKTDAAIGGKLLVATATHADPKHPPVPSRVALDAVYSVGPGNTPYHRMNFDRFAASVADVAPYSIEVMEPKAPVVQNGSMNLRIVAKRAEGFKGPITVYPLWTPPGMGIQGSATIPEGANETVLPMNAAPNATARKWKTAVIAQGDAGKGAVWVSSQLFTLEVAPPMVTFAMERAAAEQGQPAQVFCKVAVATPFAGEAIVRLIGLPAKATTTELKLTKDTKELTFPVTTDKVTPAGKHGVFCQVIVPVNGEQVAHSVGGTELRIDVPLPPKPAATAQTTPKPATPAPPVPAPPAGQPMKRLSRLEMLRLEQEEREKAAKAGQPAPKK